jgi:hypothetical protein
MTIGDIGGFTEKSERLVEKGYLSRQGKAVLDAALDAGHAATHRDYTPTSEDIRVVFDIVENLLQAWTLTESAQELTGRTPAKKGSEAATVISRKASARNLPPQSETKGGKAGPEGASS